VHFGKRERIYFSEKDFSTPFINTKCANGFERFKTPVLARISFVEKLFYSFSGPKIWNFQPQNMYAFLGVVYC